jgi:hypothetical protein
MLTRDQKYRNRKNKEIFSFLVDKRIDILRY